MFLSHFYYNAYPKIHRMNNLLQRITNRKYNIYINEISLIWKDKHLDRFLFLTEREKR